MKDTPGVLASVINKVSKTGIDLAWTRAQNLPGTDLAEWTFFGEAVDGRPSLEKLKAALQSLPNVVRVAFRESKTGVLIDNLHYPLQFANGDQAMIFSRATVQRMFGKIDEMFGSGGRFLLHELGVTSGEGDANSLVKFIGRDRAIALISELLNIYSTVGWGRPELLDFSRSPVKAMLRLHDGFECSGRKSSTPMSDFIRGHQAGFASALFERQIKVEEVTCLAMGHPHCEFSWIEK